MKFQINKASDLSSISVLPPHARRQNAAGTGVESSMLGKIQPPQLRSQQSQQSFSQGSQHGFFSQLSQNSTDDVITNDQRTGSQERESTARKPSCLRPMICQREESQLPVARPNTTNLMRKWPAPDKCQISEELEHRIGMMETSLSRSGIILDSMQSDIMQAHKGTKELALEIDSLRQRLMIHENSLQSMSKGLEDIKSCFERGLKALSDQFKQNTSKESSREISLKISAIPEKVETCILKLQNDLIKSFIREIQVVACNLQHVNQKRATPIVHPPKVINHDSVLHEMQPLISMPLPSKGHHTTSVPKIKMECWKTVKHEHVTSKGKNCNLNKSNQKRVLSSRVDWERKVTAESDEDMDGGFFSFFKEKGKDVGIYSMEDTQQETEDILRKARKRKRKHCNPIILD